MLGTATNNGNRSNSLGHTLAGTESLGIVAGDAFTRRGLIIKPLMTDAANQQLLQAAAAGDLPGVEAALQAGAAVDSRDPSGDTALNAAAHGGHLDVAARLLEAGANLENIGGADLTPLMAAAFAGHFAVVQLLLDRGALVNHDLLSSLQLKVNILAENAEAGMVVPEAVDTWKQFLGYMVTAQLRQHLPELAARLSSTERADREAALNSLKSAAYRGLDVSSAEPQLLALASDPAVTIRQVAGQTLAMHAIRQQAPDVLEQLYQTSDSDVKVGLTSGVVSAAQAGLDITSCVPTLLNLLTDATLDLRHDGAIALGYAATYGHDVSNTVPHLIRLLADPEPSVRRIGAWALYRVAKYLHTAAPAIPALQSLASDPDPDVREMAAEALHMAGG
jgi:ankyrin repeat protein